MWVALQRHSRDNELSTYKRERPLGRPPRLRLEQRSHIVQQRDALALQEALLTCEGAAEAVEGAHGRERRRVRQSQAKPA